MICERVAGRNSKLESMINSTIVLYALLGGNQRRCHQLLDHPFIKELGAAIGCRDEHRASLKYAIKLVSLREEEHANIHTQSEQG
jgi:hypothetical protein